MRCIYKLRKKARGLCVELSCLSPPKAGRTRCEPCLAKNYQSQIPGRIKRQNKKPKPSTDICVCCESKGKLVWDHCHSSGEFRGWLCNNCNVALGMVKDSISTLEKLIEYLKRNSLKKKD